MERLLNQGTRSVRHLPSHLPYACLVSQVGPVKFAMPPSSALSSIVLYEGYQYSGLIREPTCEHHNRSTDWICNRPLAWFALPSVSISRSKIGCCCLQVEEDNHTEEGSIETASERSSNGAAEAQSEGGKYAPKETFEDGSVMYSAADLVAVDYEAVSSS